MRALPGGREVEVTVLIDVRFTGSTLLKGIIGSSSRKDGTKWFQQFMEGGARYLGA